MAWMGESHDLCNAVRLGPWCGFRPLGPFLPCKVSSTGHPLLALVILSITIIWLCMAWSMFPLIYSPAAYYMSSLSIFLFVSSKIAPVTSTGDVSPRFIHLRGIRDVWVVIVAVHRTTSNTWFATVFGDAFLRRGIPAAGTADGCRRSHAR